MTKFHKTRICAAALCALVLAFLAWPPFKTIAREDSSQASEPSLPGGKGAWRVEVERSGGMLYRMDGIAINSDGEVVIKAGRRTSGGMQINCGCVGKVGDDDVSKLQRAVSSARASAWLGHYGGRAYDAPSYSITLVTRAADLTDTSHRSSWFFVDPAADPRPADLVGLNNLAWQIMEKMKGPCNFNSN